MGYTFNSVKISLTISCISLIVKNNVIFTEIDKWNSIGKTYFTDI